MTLAELLRVLLPPVAYDPAGRWVGAVIDGEAKALQVAVEQAKAISQAMHPATAGQAIAEWERVLGLKPLPSANQIGRVQAVLAKLGELGGLSKAYFLRLAAATGYRVTITEHRPFRCNVGFCGERLAGEEIVFVWEVHIDQRPAGATAQTDTHLREVFKDLGPAHALVAFTN